MTTIAWPALCQMHALQVELFHDDLETAFSDLATMTTKTKHQVSLRESSHREDGEDMDIGRVAITSSVQELSKQSEYEQHAASEASAASRAERSERACRAKRSERAERSERRERAE
jgi:hypothetical protein